MYIYKINEFCNEFRKNLKFRKNCFTMCWYMYRICTECNKIIHWFAWYLAFERTAFVKDPVPWSSIAVTDFLIDIRVLVPISIEWKVQSVQTDGDINTHICKKLRWQKLLQSSPTEMEFYIEYVYCFKCIWLWT